MKRFIYVFVLAGMLLPVRAQERLSLKRCLEIGLENNLGLKTAEGEMRKGKHSISENRAKLLPQVTAVANLNDNFNPPVSVTDGSAYGNLYNVTKTLQYNSSAGLQLQMPLYNQMVLTSVDIARTVDCLNTLSYEKAREDLVMQISKMYYLAQNTEEQIGLVKENIDRLKALRDITQAFYENGMAVEVDVKRVNINIENMQVQHDNAVSMLVQQYNLLKYVMDYPADSQIQVEPAVAGQTESVDLAGLDTNQYELQLLQTQTKLAEQQEKLARQGYLPTLSLTGSWMYSAYTDKFRNWWHSGPSNHWYNSNGLGIALRVPVFDGFEKRSKIRKAKIDVENARISYDNALKSMQTQYVNAINDLQNNQRNFNKQRDNYMLAGDVCNMTSERYREGIASMTEVLQDEMSMSEAQNNYLTAHYNYQISRLSLLKLTGQLDKLTEK
ncbi:MAG: TolC family protein [Prevotella sp.]